MTASGKKLVIVGGILAAGAAVYLGMGKLNSSESSKPAAADHPPITEMNGTSDDPKALEAALETNPTHVPILLRLGQLALDSGDAAGAVKHLEEAVRLEPNNVDARLELGRALYQSGAVDRAIEQTNKILQADPHQVDALYNLGAIYANQKQPDRAKEFWTRAVAAGPETPSGRSAQQGLNVLNGGAATTAAAPASPHPPMPATRDAKQALLDFNSKPQAANPPAL